MTDPHTDDDPYLWLEDLESPRALEWVKALNRASTAELAHTPAFESLRERLLAVYDSDARIPSITKLGRFVYNLWRSREHVRGIWRRTTLDEFRKPEPRWQTVLDVDALAESEGENWVWAGASGLYPEFDRCLVFLSRGGKDSCVVREFDLEHKQFVQDGFSLPDAKSDVTWRDRDTLFVATDFGPGSLTSSGYPRVLKLWRRGTPLVAATTVIEAEPSDVGVSAEVFQQAGVRRELITRTLDFRNRHVYVCDQDEWVRLDVPADASLACFRDQLLLILRSELQGAGQTHPAGSMLAIAWQAFRAGDRDFSVLFSPSPRTSLVGFTRTLHGVILNVLDNVHNVLSGFRLEAGQWQRQAVASPELGTIHTYALDRDESDDYVMWTTGFLTPDSLWLGTLGRDEAELLKQLPKFFDADGLEVTQHFARSPDGTEIPYFQVARTGLARDHTHMTLLSAYGGFQIANTPEYNAALGLAWLERGGVYVLANIRGGGEFGPAWHQAALQRHRQRAYDDFLAVAGDLIARGVTAPQHLGISGGSNGGLLVGVAVTQRPELFGAAVCQVPLLDMRRYHKLLAGASWIAEYGDPDDPDAWQYISKYSPYHNLREGQRYPRILFTTSTRDDRVHPAHARKMVAKLLAQGHDALLYENIEGGHGGAANNPQRAFMGALAYTFLARELR